MGNPSAVAAGDDVLAKWGNDVHDRVVPIFANAATRDTQLPTPEKGRVCWIEDEERLMVWRGAQKWVDVITNLQVLEHGWQLTFPDNSWNLSRNGVELHKWFKDGSQEMRLGGSVRVKLDSSGILELYPQPAGTDILRIGGDGGNATTGRRYSLRRAAQYGALELVAFQSDGTAHSVLYISDNGKLRLPEVATDPAASGTAIGITASGDVTKLSSSRRYKQDIADYRTPAQLPVALKRWRYAAEVADVGDLAPYHVGPIAEDVHDAGLTEFVNYDADGRPESLESAALALAHTAHLEARVATLEARIAALEAN